MKAQSSDRITNKSLTPRHSASLKEFVDRIATRFDADASQLLHNGRNTVRRFVLSDGETVVVKRFKRPNFFQALGWITHGSKAARAFRNAAELKARGFDTPRALAFVDYGTAPFATSHSFLVTDEIVATPIQARLEKPEVFDSSVANAFARFAAALHEAGILHHDLNSTNVIYTRDDTGRFRFSLIDINRMTFLPVGETPSVSECITNLLRFTGRYDVMEAVARTYAESRNLDPTIFVKRVLAAKRRHDSQWRMRKRLKKLFRPN